jgi:hypothetical protein
MTRHSDRSLVAGPKSLPNTTLELHKEVIQKQHSKGGNNAQATSLSDQRL